MSTGDLPDDVDADPRDVAEADAWYPRIGPFRWERRVTSHTTVWLGSSGNDPMLVIRNTDDDSGEWLTSTLFTPDLTEMR